MQRHGDSGEAKVLVPWELDRAHALVTARLPEVAHGAQEGPAFPHTLGRGFQQSLARVQLLGPESPIRALSAVSPGRVGLAVVSRAGCLVLGVAQRFLLLGKELQQSSCHGRVQLRGCAGEIGFGERRRRWWRSGGLWGSLLWWENARRTCCGRVTPFKQHLNNHALADSNTFLPSKTKSKQPYRDQPLSRKHLGKAKQKEAENPKSCHAV